ncbi:nitroreductase family deazaflavin-dependent oxidoreductase [Micromonospora sp. PLK6-60]|uniref:nitroreductase family deazaflavin-dependent oxidoreductase n=1 Tax=Micromonospora sp. PLK6-60 TaxID=2873383 RepID=UPI001CA79789|nr:nitroreductase family deazaflavin-dependent oxidoreductase [Micromonospora sp. PLK6-60]MBY8875576.1 nitroreductase family deazaflavin-dependent oxidoreductase [Micromonospora sp. PLK6-60]
MAQRYWRPDRFTIKVLNPLVRAAGGTTLEVAGRRTGRIQRIPVNLLEHGGGRYVVAMRGNTEWTRNLRAAGRCAIRRGLRRATYHATELPLDERQLVVDAYRAKWPGQSRRFFDRLPDVADHPVFRLDADG